MAPPNRLETTFRAARMYYEDGHTMESIASTLDVSRSTVSRMLRDAREEGLVQISLHPPGAPRLEELRRTISHRYRVRAHVVAVPPAAGERERLQSVAAAGAAVLEDLLEPGMTVGMAWGTTVSALVAQLRPRPTPGLRIVQLNGAIDTEGAGLTYVSAMLTRAAELWDATVHHFPVPAFFDYADTRAAMWRERSVQRVLATQQQCTLAVFGVGAFEAEVPSHVYTNNYLAPADLASLRADGAVGDVCTVFLRADGTYRDIAMNQRRSGPDPSQLAGIPHRLLVASGRSKSLPLRAALRAGVATDIVVDEVTAAGLLALR
ncbi:sugar-binding transcriptional regulator [Brachybacterium hainanense]|uniref:Sugar-binding transcriptional regulator n=1 Tax=Brachybacterium hainanense TaxID=1541174 RepID=A0ABV6R710_9MICO